MKKLLLSVGWLLLAATYGQVSTGGASSCLLAAPLLIPPHGVKLLKVK